VVADDKRPTAMVHVADLSDGAERLELADALEEAGRSREALILRAECKAVAHRGEVWRVAEKGEWATVLIDSPDDPPCAPLGDGPLGCWCYWGSGSLSPMTNERSEAGFGEDEIDLDRTTGRFLREGERLVVITSSTASVRRSATWSGIPFRGTRRSPCRCISGR